MQNLSAHSLFRRQASGNSGIRGVLLFVLCMTMALRAFALPLSMVGHNDFGWQQQKQEVQQPLAAEPAAMSTDCYSKTHDSAPAQDPTLSKAPTPAMGKLCLILCDIAGAPLLIPAQVKLATTGFEVMNDSKATLSLGLIPAPDHPPPIA